MDYWPEDYIELRRHADRHRLQDHALVLRATGLDARLVYDGGQFVLIVPRERALSAAAELLQYEAEQQPPPPVLEPLPRRGPGSLALAAYVACLLLAAICQQQSLFDAHWMTQGALAVSRVVQGEWWRLVTALTLHLDTPHLMGNLLVGGVFVFFLGRLLGDGLAVFCILGAATVGNAMDVALQPPGFVAAGASTAVFAALGLLCGYSWRMRRSRRVSWALRWGPVVAGVILLAWLGTGDETTDIVAHLTGFLAGMAVGAALPGLGLVPRTGPGAQGLLGAVSAATVLVAWSLALAAG